MRHAICALRTLVAAAGIFCGVANASETARLADLDWLTGLWQAQSGKDSIEEVYSPANNGEIFGTVKTLTDGKVTRYEIRRFREENGRMLLQAVMYDGALKPAAAVPNRTVLATDPTRVALDNATIVRTGDNTMKVIVNAATPTASAIEINYKRVFKFTAP